MKMPLRFEPINGMTDAPNGFFVRGPGFGAWVTASSVRLRLQQPLQAQDRERLFSQNLPGAARRSRMDSTVQLQFVGANPAARLIGIDGQSGRVNHLRGNDPASWRRSVPVFGKIRCEGIYPGIDVAYYGTRQEQLEYDFIVAPGGNPNVIVLALAGVEQVSISSEGHLLLEATSGQARLLKPVIYQVKDGQREEIEGGYEILVPHGPSELLEPTDPPSVFVKFRIAGHDPALPLVIDPILSYATYLGGSGHDAPGALAVDGAGDVYLTGWTQSADLPTTNALGATLQDTDAFVMKLKSDGSGFVYATYFGGSSGDFGAGIALDPAGNAYVTGFTWGGSDFPLISAYQSSHAGGQDAFVAKLSADGSSLLYSTLLGGSGNDQGRDIAVDSSGQAHVTGMASSGDFPVSAEGVQTNLSGAWDVFVAKLGAGGSNVIYSTFLGGNGDEFSYLGPNLELDPTGHALVAGYTSSTNFPTTPGAFQTQYGGGANDLFVAKLAKDGADLIYSTYLGGADWDAYGGYLAVDGEGCAYVADVSASTNFPLVPSPLSHTARYPDLFTRQGTLYLTKLSPDGASIRFSIRLPGDHSGGLALDGGGHAWVAGDVQGHPVTIGAFPLLLPVQANYGGGDYDAFLLKVAPDGDRLLFATLLGGSGRESSIAVATDKLGHAYLLGDTTSTNLPTTNAIQSIHSGAADVFVVKLRDPDTIPPTILALGNYGDSNVVTIDFSEALDLASATNAANYTLDGGIVILSARMGINSRSVRLETSGLTPGTHYTLSATNILDRAPVPNSIGANTTASFTAMNLYRGFLRQENYSGIEPFGNLQALTTNEKFPDTPDASTLIHEFEIAPNAYYQDGIRLSGWLLPPVTGEYIFYLCNVSEAALYLSRDASPLNKLRVAFEYCGFACGGSGSRHWNHVTPGWNASPQSTVSLPIHLEKGRAYYIEVIAGSSAANVLGLAWRMPDQPPLRDLDPPISGAYLALLSDPTSATLTITQQPTSVTIAEGESAAFTVRATGSPSKLFYQWRENGTNLPFATAPSLLLNEVSLSDEGKVVDCVVTSPGATVTSQGALLSVTNDVTSPTLISAEGDVSNEHVTLTFSEPIRLEDATNTVHYALSGGLTVSKALLLADRKTVVLTTSPQSPGISYTVAVSGIRDRSTAANPVDPARVTSFFGWVDEQFVGPFSSWANVKDDYGAVGNGIADDTDAIQQALDEVATPGHAAVLYFPTGTYRITGTLQFASRLSASLIGEEPANTVIKWDGPIGGEMMVANGVAYSRWSRLTWDGASTASIAIRHGYAGMGPQVTQNQHTDEIFRDLGAGLVVDPVNGGDTHLVIRCHFLRCSIQGIAVSSYNAIDWHIWDSVFEDCKYGLQSYVGNFHVYRSLFLRSVEADIRAGLYYTGIRDNLSIGSKAFVENLHLGMSGILQGNTVVAALAPTAVSWVAGNGVLVLDNTFITSATPPGSPTLKIENNLLSAGNTYTITNPIAVGGRNLQMEDRIVSPDSLSPPPVVVQRFLLRSASPVIEVPVGANAAAIQHAIDAAVALHGQRPIVHLPSGQFQLDRTLTIPANCDLQLVGDGYAGHGTTILGPNLPGEPVIFLAGPSRATLRDFHVLGSGAGFQNALGSGITLENCDQAGARVFLEQVIVNFSLTNNLVANRLDHVDVSAHDFLHGDAQSVSVRVIGGKLQEAGSASNARVALFGGGTGGGQSVYSVERGGRLLVQDCWYEGEGRIFMRCADAGTLTLNNVRIAPTDPNHGGAADGVLEIDDFQGAISLLNASFLETTVSVAGDGSESHLLLLGCHGTPNITEPITPTYLDNQSPNARVEHWFSESDGRQIPHTTEPDPVFLRRMLEQLRTDKPRRLVALQEGVTDARLFRVSVEACKYGMLLSGSNTPPELSPRPVQYGVEDSLLLVTNVVTGPDAPYGLYAFTLGPGTPTGMAIDPDSGAIQWTPTEAQGPSTNEIPVIVTALSSPLLKATNVVTIVVREVNQPPTLLADRRLAGSDIGAPPYPGSTTNHADGSIEVVGSGFGTYWGDSFHFSYEQVEGDFDVGVEIRSIEGGTSGASAGLMARAALESDSPFVQLSLNPLGGSAWWPAYRVVPGAFPTLWQGSAGGGGKFPSWLRLRRQGQIFRALVKYEDTDWQQVSEVLLPAAFPTRLYLGLCTWSWAAGQDPGNPPPQTRVIYRNYRNYPTQLPNSITNRTVDEGEAIMFQALAQDPDVPSVLTFSLDGSAPEGASIDPVTGVFLWVPSEQQGPGAYEITIRVTDNGEPPLSDARTFTATVAEVNASPALTATGPRNVNEHELLAFTVNAQDSNDIPPNAVQLSASNLPAGATFDPLTGGFAWTPGESQDGEYTATFTATDDGAPPLAVSAAVTLTVKEVNEAPVLGALADYTVNAGQAVNFQVTAADTDQPSNKLSFRLVGSPGGAAINPVDGWFHWRPFVALANTTNVFQVEVHDDGVPVLKDVQSFQVVVNPLQPVLLTPVGFSKDQFQFLVSGMFGPDYVVTASSNLTNWNDLLTNYSAATPFLFNDAAAGAFSNRVYRIRLEP